MTTNTEPYLIGIAGGTGSGKTHFVQMIVTEMGEDRCLVIQQDAYYHDLSHLPFGEREKVNFDHPSAGDFELLVSHLRDLKKGREVLLPVYDFSTHTRKATVSRDLKERGRSKESVLRQYERTVVPMQREYVEPSSRHANLILPYEGDTRGAMDLVVAALRGRG